MKHQNAMKTLTIAVLIIAAIAIVGIVASAEVFKTNTNAVIKLSVTVKQVQRILRSIHKNNSPTLIAVQQFWIIPH